MFIEAPIFNVKNSLKNESFIISALNKVIKWNKSDFRNIIVQIKINSYMLILDSILIHSSCIYKNNG